MVNLEKYMHYIDEYEPIKQHGRITQAVGLTTESYGPPGSIGELCYIDTPDARHQGRNSGVPGSGNRPDAPWRDEGSAPGMPGGSLR